MIPRPPLVAAILALIGCATPRWQPQGLPPPARTHTREVFVLGQVTRPGVVFFRPGMDVRAAIAECGGLTPFAYKKGVVITREAADGRKVRVRISIDEEFEAVLLAGGDMVFVTGRDT